MHEQFSHVWFIGNAPNSGQPSCFSSLNSFSDSFEEFSSISRCRHMVLDDVDTSSFSVELTALRSYARVFIHFSECDSFVHFAMSLISRSILPICDNRG